MGFAFLKAVEKFGLSVIPSLVEAGADLRVILVRPGNSATAERATAEFVGSLTTLNEFDGVGYARQPLAAQLVNANAGTLSVECKADPNVWNPLDEGPSTDQVHGAIIYWHVTNDADSPVLTYYDSGGFPKPATGSPFTVTWAGDGFLKFTTITT